MSRAVAGFGFAYASPDYETTRLQVGGSRVWTMLLGLHDYFEH